MEIPGHFVFSLKMMAPGGRRGCYGEENQKKQEKENR
jgi:hypothetical protein